MVRSETENLDLSVIGGELMNLTMDDIEDDDMMLLDQYEDMETGDEPCEKLNDWDNETWMKLADMGWNHGYDTEVRILLAGTNHQRTNILVELGMENIIEIPAVLDSGSDVSFLSREVLLRNAPEVLQQTMQCPVRFAGIAGDALKTYGMLELTCRIENKVVRQVFVIADIVEGGLLGLDFQAKYKVVWCWWSNKIKFDWNGCQPLDVGNCKLLKDLELPNQCMMCYQVRLEGLDETVDHVFIQGEVGSEDGVFLADSLVKVENGMAHLMIGNSGYEDVILPAESVVAVWNCLNDTDFYEIDELTTELDVRRVLYNTTDNSEQKPEEEEENCDKQMEGISDEMEEIPEENEVKSRQMEGISDEMEEIPDEIEIIPEEIQKLIVDCYGSMEENELKEVKDILLKYTDVFTIKGETLGRTSWECHRIDVGETVPIKQQPRRIPLHQVDVVEEMINDMERDNVIRPSESPWASPVVIVAKKDGSCRFCVDYRKLNAITTKDAYPIPRVDENLDALAGNRWFTSLDMASGYWQVEMSEKDKAKTAFVTRFGLFEWNVMPFGLCNAPATSRD